MPARCQVTGRTVGFGNAVSHSHRRTRRRWSPNIQTKTYYLPSEGRRITAAGERQGNQGHRPRWHRSRGRAAALGRVSGSDGAQRDSRQTSSCAPPPVPVTPTSPARTAAMTPIGSR